MEEHTVVINKSLEMEQRRAGKLLASRTTIALLAAAHMRAMLEEGWVMQSDEHGGKILVAANTRLAAKATSPSMLREVLG